MKKKIAALAALSVLAGVLGAAPASAAAARTYEIYGGVDLTREAFSGRFFPSTLTVHEGDTLHFFDTGQIILPLGYTEPPEGLDQFIVRGPDGWTLNWAIFDGNLPSEGCGQTAEDACDYDGSDYLMAPDTEFDEGEEPPWMNGFYMKIAPGMDGKTFYAHNLINRIKIKVDNGAAQSPVQDPTADAKIANLKEDAKALQAKLNSRQTFHRDAKGRKVWDAYAGFETRTMMFFGMYPRTLKVRKGDRVQWHFSQLNTEPHTVSMSPMKAQKRSDAAFEQLFSEAGTLPDSWVEGNGSGKYSGPTGGLRHSGLRGDKSSVNDDPFTVQFTKPSTAKGYKYLCALHSFAVSNSKVFGMQGKVVVK